MSRTTAAARRPAFLRFAALAVATLALAAAPLPDDKPEGISVDPALPRYAQVKDLKGSVSVIGSSTVCSLLDRQADQFRSANPGVSIEIKGGGSGEAPKALLAGTADLAPMSRPMKATERAEFEKKFGYAPTELVVGLDAIGVFVNKGNPIEGLTVEDVTTLFGEDPAGRKTVRTWGQLGLGGEWQARKVLAFGFRDGTGGASIMKESVLGDANFRDDLKVERVSSSIVNGVGAEPGGVGYASQFYRTKQTRMVPLAAKKGDPFVAPSQSAVSDGSYPLSRKLYVYVNQKPGTPMQPAALEFLRFILSRSGQEIAARDGNFPISGGMATAELAKLR